MDITPNGIAFAGLVATVGILVRHLMDQFGSMEKQIFDLAQRVARLEGRCETEHG